MNENSKSRKHRYNKRKRSDDYNLTDMERNINSNDSIKVTIMNNLNTQLCDEIVDENESGKSDDDGGAAEGNTFLLKIIFSNNKKYCELKTNVFNSIKQGLHSKNLIMVENDNKNLIEIFENLDENLQVDTAKSNKVEMGDDLFTIDTEPEKLSQKSKVIEIPVYSKDKFTNIMVMAESTRKKINPPTKGRSGGMSCFNCGENHNLKDCQKPRNHAKIQQGLTKLKGGERYHIELNQKYANVVPGKLSNALRDALGLRKNEIPSHVYRMRLFGYPPGWLEDHKISNSGLTLFDSNGKTVGDPDEEQGEIVEKERFDLNKIIEFPGFNVPPTKQNQYDDYHRNRVPPRSVNHSKEAMISYLSDKLVTPYKRKKLINFPGVNTKSDDNNVEEHCMEIEDDDDFCGPMLPLAMQPPLPDDELSDSNAPPPPPPPPPVTTTSIDSDESGELISDDDEKVPNKKMKTSSSLNINLLPSTDPSPKLEKSSTEISFESNLPDESPENNLCKTKFETSGTPLLQFSPYTSLPSGDKFSVGVSDVINFENLPDSTGKYETMKEIIKRVRNQMDKMHDDVC